jgi:hypothetical protein
MSVRVPVVAALAAAALAVTASPALAVVSFDPVTGTGFVGKGDVQLALGWNNKQLQEGATSLTFTTFARFSSWTTWECTAEDGTLLPQRNGFSSDSWAEIGYEVRGEPQATGFVLTGPVDGSSIGVGGGPQIDTCPAGSVLTTPAGPPVVVDESGFLVNGAPLG